LRAFKFIFERRDDLKTNNFDAIVLVVDKLLEFSTTNPASFQTTLAELSKEDLAVPAFILAVATSFAIQEICKEEKSSDSTIISGNESAENTDPTKMATEFVTQFKATRLSAVNCAVIAKLMKKFPKVQESLE
jgi:hypothetical protein